MEMDMELEPRVKPLPYKVKAVSRESASQKAVNILDQDLRTHWSTGTNTKEWILLELEQPCLLSHIRIYNKSVLEWEISVSLRYKPEAFAKARSRCEAPRRDMVYPMNYAPCRYVRISCLRGNPIGIFFVQLIGISVDGLEAEFQPVVNYLLPHIVSHKQEAEDIYLQLLQDMTNRLLPFLPQLEGDLVNFPESPEYYAKFFAMLVGPFYPILYLLQERESAKGLEAASESDVLKHNQPPALMISSNFEAQVRRSRSSSAYTQSVCISIAFRPDIVFMLLRKAYKDSQLGSVCRVVCQAIRKLSYPLNSEEASISTYGTSMLSADTHKDESPSNQIHISDYSSLFGNDFEILNYNWDSRLLHVLNTSSVEEGVLHVLYACASEPFLCHKLAENSVELWSALPLVQAMLPALRPVCSHLDKFDDTFSQWNQPFVQKALSQIVAALTSSLYHPLLHACAGYLSSFSQSHTKAACLLIDLCFGPLAPWVSTVIAKIDLSVELLEDLMSTIQDSHRSASRARAALKYFLLALSGHMDDILAKYKEAKHKLLFLIEILEPFLDPALTTSKNAIAFGDVSPTCLEKQERDCALSLNVIQRAVHRQAVLSALESEWKRGNVAPSVLLSILGPHMDLPSDIDLSKYSDSKLSESVSLDMPSGSLAVHQGGIAKSNSNNGSNTKIDTSEAALKMDVYEDAQLLFAPVELKNIILRNVGKISDGSCLDKNNPDSSLSCSTLGNKHLFERIFRDRFKGGLVLDMGLPAEFFNLQADYLQLVNHQICELKASEFQHLAHELHSQPELNPEGHDAAIDSLLLAAECYVNPFFLMSFRESSKLSSLLNNRMEKVLSHNYRESNSAIIPNDVKVGTMDAVADLERKRDKIVLQIILLAASLDKEFCLRRTSNGVKRFYEIEESMDGIELSSLDKPHVDAVTLVRQNQALLCHFVIQHLQRDQHPMHEILLQCLLFLLHSATDLACSAVDVVDIILHSAEQLNGLLISLYCQLKEGSLQLNPEKVHQVQRRWILLQSLVVACCGADGSSYLTFKVDGFQYRNLVPPSAWIERIPKFSCSQFPLVRFLGWMAVASYAKKFFKERLYLVSDLSEMTGLLFIFTDELAISVDEVPPKKMDNFGLEHLKIEELVQESNGFGCHRKEYSEKSFQVIYPYLQQFFPNMKRQFETFGEVILEAVGLQLKYLPHQDIPDALCWFSELCLWPFRGEVDNSLTAEISSDHVKGSAAKNARLIILYVLETIIAEHMEAIVPEIPKVMQILRSMCRNSYFDVAFLNSVLRLLKPLISYALRKAYDDENLQTDESSCQNFESLCFKELFSNITINHEEINSEKPYHGALIVFTLGALFSDISFSTRKEAFKYLLSWADFVSFERTSSFHAYLCAFQKLMENCLEILTQMFRNLGISLPRRGTNSPVPEDVDKVTFILDNLYSSLLSEITKEFDEPDPADYNLKKKIQSLQVEEITDFCTELQNLALKLCPNVDQCWKLHPQLAKKLVIASSRCYIYSKCLFSIHHSVSMDGIENNSNALFSNSDDYWKSALGDFADAIMGLVQSCRWQVASVMLDYLLLLPRLISVEHVMPSICSVIKYFCCHAPQIPLRLQTDKWLLILFVRDTSKLDGNSTSLAELFSAMLNHSEPEQRSIAIQHLGRVVRQGSSEPLKFFSPQKKTIIVDFAFSFSRSFLSLLVSDTWDMVAVIASSDSSPLLRAHATMLLLEFIPFARQNQLQSLLCSCDKILYGLDKVNRPMREGLLTWLSLALIGKACLYSPLDDIAFVPQSVWVNLEVLGKAKTEENVGKLEKACRALCNLRNQEDSAREALREALSSTTIMKDRDPEFEKTRESIFQVVATLNSAESYFELFTRNKDQEAMEIEEAEMEFDLIRSEARPHLSSEGLSGEALQYLNSPLSSSNLKEENRLEVIKDSILSLEKAKIKEEVAVRRQKKLHELHIRQKYLEEAASREAHLLLELDRERTTEKEREIERQKLLELERAKTREVRHNLEMERERQLQKELQRELEQPETGIRSSQRREFASTTSSRPRDRYRERETGRGGAEGSLRSSSRDHESGQAPTNLLTSIPTIVLSGSRTFAGQTPTILQSRDRTEDHSSTGGLEEIFEGGRDQGDTGSMGDPELSSAFEPSPGSFALAHKQGSRTGKSRQILERRDRDSRREGKWERKQP